jgi:hypothetical protein
MMEHIYLLEAQKINRRLKCNRVVENRQESDNSKDKEGYLPAYRTHGALRRSCCVL